MNIYDFELIDIDSKRVSMSSYKNKVLLIVNVASKCGFTPQYKELELLYKKYKDRGFEILAFPSNQFASQEPAPNSKIKEFCELNFGVTFKLFAKIDVNEKNADPLYKYLTSHKRGIFGTKAIKWNFTKFLIDRDGNIVKRYAPATPPNKLQKDIEELL